MCLDLTVELNGESNNAQSEHVPATGAHGAFRVRMQGSKHGAGPPGIDITKERTMSNHPRSTDDLPYGEQPQPERDSENSELETFDQADDDSIDEQSDDSPIDDPGDAQRSSKSEPDGDGEEEMR
jgi:hypothetical protein